MTPFSMGNLSDHVLIPLGGDGGLRGVREGRQRQDFLLCDFDLFLHIGFSVKSQ